MADHMADHMTDHMESSDWLDILYTKTEDEVLQMIKKEPRLAELQLQFKCQLEGPVARKTPCRCCINFETLQSESNSIDEMMSDFKSYLQTGYCHHLSSQVEDGNYDVTRISISHIAVAFGKLKVLKEVLPKFTGTSNEFWRDFNEKYSTGVIGLNPLNLSIIHQRFDAFSLVLKKCKNFAKAKIYTIKTFPNLGILCGHCVTLAAELNGLNYLLLIARHCVGQYSMSEIQDGFYVALYFRSYECCDLLLSMLNRSKHYRPYNCQIHKNILHLISDSDDERMFSYLIRYKYIDRGQCISHFIKKGKEQYVKKLLTRKPQKGSRDISFHQHKTSFVIQALLHKCSLDMLQIILKYGSKENHQMCSANGYNGMNWALALQHREAENLLKSYGIKANPGIEETNPPLIATFDYYSLVKSPDCDVDVGFISIMKKLIDLGHDVNAETPNGTTALVKAVELMRTLDVNKVKFLPVVRLLLLNGADPYKGNASPYLYVNNYVITEFLFCNVNMCINNFMSSILRNILVSNYSGFLISLILKYSHTIPSHYKRALNHMHAIPRGFISVEELNMADDLFTNPRSLLILCRNSFRRFHGYKIHRYLRQIELPSQIKRILTLEDELKEDGMLLHINSIMESTCLPYFSLPGTRDLN